MSLKSSLLQTTNHQLQTIKIMIKKTPIIWALVDERAGNTSQVLGVAEAFNMPFIIKNIRYNRLGRISNFIKGKSLLGLTHESKAEICAPWPDVVISVASRMESAALYIKKQNPSAKLVHIQKPKLPIRNFDLVTTPEHDFLNKEKSAINKSAVPANVLLTLGAPNRINASVLAKGQEKWQAQFAHLPKPHIALLVGGSTNKHEFLPAHAKDLASKANQLVADTGGSLLVTTSRRTPVDAIEILKTELPKEKYFYDVRDNTENPYAGLLAFADIIIASGDSTSMCSESCTTGKTVYIYSPEDITPPKFHYFHKKLIEGGYARMLGEGISNNSYAPLNDSKIIADYIKKNYC